ncbi:MAG: exosortase-associated EpsI family protein [Chloroflexi bacterium]|nr:exosortase-associated EpsI family protein [Chloroflexota bacterium]
MNFLRQYSLILGLSILIIVIVLLLSSADLLFSSGVTFIDTELNRSSGQEVYVKTTMDFGSHEHLQTFPMTVGDWRGWPYETAEWEALLKTDLMIMRGYVGPGSYDRPLFFLAMQADTESSFHPPHICYPAAG